MNRSRTDSPSARAAPTTTLRPAPIPTSDLDFVSPWADETTLVVDISGDEPTAHIEGDVEVLILPMHLWLTQLAEVRSEIQDLKAEIRSLRETVNRSRRA